MYGLNWIALSFIATLVLFFVFLYGNPAERVVENITIIDSGFETVSHPKASSVSLYYYDIKMDDGELFRVYSPKRNAIKSGLVALDKRFSIFYWAYRYDLADEYK